MSQRAVAERPIKFSQIYGPAVTIPYELAASQVFKHAGGAFVDMDANRRIQIATASSTDLVGWGVFGDGTTSSTAGQQQIPVNVSLDAFYLMPIDTAQTEAQLLALLHKTCDLVVASNIQYADFDASAKDNLIIEDYRYWGSALGEQALIVRMNPNKIGQTGV